MPKPDITYALEVLNDEFKDQRHLLKHVSNLNYVKEIYKETEIRIEQLKRAIKYLKEYKEEA